MIRRPVRSSISLAVSSKNRLGSRGYHHIAAFLGEFYGDGFADTAAATAYKCALISQSEPFEESLYLLKTSVAASEL